MGYQITGKWDTKQVWINGREITVEGFRHDLQANGEGEGEN
jgi:hypothetical protein